MDNDLPPLNTRSSALEGFQQTRRETSQDKEFAKTRQIGVLKLVLPITTAIVAVIVLIWITFGDKAMDIAPSPSQAVEAIMSDQVTKPSFTTQDREGRPYTLLSDKASRHPEREDWVILTNPSGDVRLENGRWLALQALEGVVNQETQILDLTKDVQLFDDQGYTLQTADMHIDIEKQNIHTKSAVTGHGPAGQMQSAGLDLNMEKGVLTLIGPARITLYNQQGLQDLP